MTFRFKTVVLTLVLQLTATYAQTNGLINSTTDMTVGKVTGNSEVHMPTKNGSSPFPEDSYSSTPSFTTKMLLPSDPTAAAPTNSTLSQLNLKTTTDEQIQGRGTTIGVTTLVINQSTGTMDPPMLTNSTQRQNTSKTTTFNVPIHNMSQMSSKPEVSTQPISTTTTATEPTIKKSASPMPIQKIITSKSTTVKRKPFNQITKNNLREKHGKSKGGPTHGKIVAGLIGGALIVMVLGFLLIYVKKRRFQKQQITTAEWAGPSPFLDGVVEKGQINQMSSNHISLASFLPQRLSKRFSLRPDMEFQDMMGDTTFTNKQGITFCQDAQSSDVQESNGIDAKNNSTEDDKENSVSVTFLQTNTVSKNDNSEAPDVGQQSPPTVSESVESAFMQMNDD